MRVYIVDDVPRVIIHDAVFDSMPHGSQTLPEQLLPDAKMPFSNFLWNDLRDRLNPLVYRLNRGNKVAGAVVGWGLVAWIVLHLKKIVNHYHENLSVLDAATLTGLLAFYVLFYMYQTHCRNPSVDRQIGILVESLQPRFAAVGCEVRYAVNTKSRFYTTHEGERKEQQAIERYLEFPRIVANAVEYDIEDPAPLAVASILRGYLDSSSGDAAAPAGSNGNSGIGSTAAPSAAYSKPRQPSHNSSEVGDSRSVFDQMMAGLASPRTADAATDVAFSPLLQSPPSPPTPEHESFLGYTTFTSRDPSNSIAGISGDNGATPSIVDQMMADLQRPYENN